MTITKLADKISDVFLALLISFSLVFALTSSLCLTYPVLSILLLVVLCVALFCVMFHNKTTSIVSFSAIGLTLLVSVLYIMFGTGLDKVVKFFDDYFFWLSEFILYPDPEAVDQVFQFVTVLALCIIFSLFSYLFIVRKFRFLVVMISGTALFAIQWSYAITSSLIPFYLFLVAALIIYLRHIYQSKLSKGPNDYARPAQIALWSLPVCILIIALAYSIHASNKPIEWKWLDKKVVSVYNYFKKNFDYETFDYFSLSSTSGFGDRNNILGGRVRLDRTNVLQVTTPKRVYLKGISLDTYTGTKWINSDPSLMSKGYDYTGMYSDTEEMLEGMKILTGSDDYLDEYFEKNPVSVVFLNIKTKSLFLPSKTEDFKTSTKNFLAFENDTGDYSSKQRYSRGFRYTAKMYNPKIGSEEFADIIRKSKKGLYSEALVKMKLPEYYVNFKEYYLGGIGSTTSGAIISYTSGTSDSAFSVFQTTTGSGLQIPVITSPDKMKTFETLTKLKRNSIEIHRNYLQLPENLPQRVKDLSASLVASETNDYDKAKAIEQYLASKYPYNLDVRSTPRNRDFVDYFLFDLKEGYCSYYASAMTVLARCAGLPARYVEGYMLPSDPVKDDRTTYVVSNMQAHAWVEIYFEGYGWLPFEPTAPFRSNFYTTSELDSDVNFSDSYDSSYADYMEELMKRYSNQGGGYVDFGPDTATKGPSAVIIALFTLTGLVILAVVLLMANIIRNRLRLYKMINLPANECVLNFYNYFVDVLGLQGLGLLPSETPFQYSARIDSNMFFIPVRFKVITDIFVKSRYSTEIATENEKQLFCDFHPGFLSEIKINMGKFKYFTLKYLLGRF